MDADTGLEVSSPVSLLMKTYLLERAQTIPCSRSEAFAFFSDAFNLELITPPFLRFRILTQPPIKMEAGTFIEYRIRLFGIPISWETLIESCNPDESFVDLQMRGPYDWWQHTHSFEEKGPRSVLVRDRVEYRIPYGLIGRIAHSLFIERWLAEIFDYRATVTARLLGVEEGMVGTPTSIADLSPLSAATRYRAQS